MTFAIVKGRQRLEGKSQILQARSRSLLRALTPQTADIKPTWTVSEIRNALNQHERGDFQNSAQLADEFRRDDRLPGNINRRIQGVIGAPFDLEPPEMDRDVDQRMADEIADRIKSRWFDMFPEDVLLDSGYWRHTMGFALSQLEWTREPDFWLPRLDPWHPIWSYYLREERQWHIQTREEGDVIVEPGNGRWVLQGPGRRPYMHGLIRSLADVWIARRFTWRDWARFNERHGLAIIKAMIPAVADDDEQEAFVEDLRVLGTEAAIGLPQGLDEQGSSFDLDLLEASDQAWETFDRKLDKTADSFAVNVLGNNLNSEVRGGSFAAAKTGEGVLVDLKKFDAGELSTTLRSQALVHVVTLNWPVGPEFAPWPRWKVEPEADLKAKGEALEAAGKGIAAIKDAGYTIRDADQFGETFGIELDSIDGEDDDDPPPPGTPVPNEGEGGAKGEPDAVDAEDGKEDDELEEEERKTMRRKYWLQSGDDPSAARGMIDGQAYTDDVADAAIKQAQAAINPDLLRLIKIVDTSEDFGDLRARIREAFAGMDPDELARTLEAAIIMTELAGRRSALVDTSDDEPEPDAV